MLLLFCFQINFACTRSDSNLLRFFFSLRSGQTTLDGFAAKSASLGAANQNVAAVPRSRDDTKYKAWQAAGEQHFVSASADCLFPFSLADQPTFRKLVEHLSGGVFHLHHKDKAKKIIIARSTEVANAVHYVREHDVLVLFLLLIFMCIICAR